MTAEFSRRSWHKLLGAWRGADGVIHRARRPRPAPTGDVPTIATLTDLIVDAEIALRNYLVAQSQALQPDGCCSDPTWRGHLCPYHEGYADGIDMVLDHSALIDEFVEGLSAPRDVAPLPDA